MTKGALVIAMVIYHSFNYSGDYTLGFKYLPFLPPSFILITGFLVGRLYLRAGLAHDRRVHGRLLFRGIRLLLLFTFLNVLTQLAGRHRASALPQGLDYLADYWYEIYALGGGQFASFSILLPIAYLLLLAPILILLHRANRMIVPVLALGVAILCTFPGGDSEASVNLALLSAGLIGVVLGGISDGALTAMGRYWYSFVALYLGYFAFSHWVWQSRFDQLLDACLAVAAIFGVCRAMELNSTLGRRLLILGHYSLLAYILQIGVLQVLSRIFGRLAPFSLAFFLQMLGVLMFMVLCTEILEFARKRSTWLDTSYRWVFA